jgi:large subunit ribosomal protein L19e
MKTQKRLAAQILNCSEKRIMLDKERLEDIKEAITKADIRSLVKDGAIKRKPVKGISKVRTRKRKGQKRRGQRRGLGKRKGKSTARLPKKKAWMNKIRIQRRFLKELREKGLIKKSTYRELYSKASGGFFRSKRHLKLYITDNKLVLKK